MYKMENIEQELKRLSDEIISGSIDDIKYLMSLKDETMTQYDYVYLIVRSLFLTKLKEKIEGRKKKNRLILVGTCCSLLMAYFILRKK